jgi:hypothetical protein
MTLLKELNYFSRLKESILEGKKPAFSTSIETFEKIAEGETKKHDAWTDKHMLFKTFEPADLTEEFNKELNDYMAMLAEAYKVPVNNILVSLSNKSNDGFTLSLVSPCFLIESGKNKFLYKFDFEVVGLNSIQLVELMKVAAEKINNSTF